MFARLLSYSVESLIVSAFIKQSDSHYVGVLLLYKTMTNHEIGDTM